MIFVRVMLSSYCKVGGEDNDNTVVEGSYLLLRREIWTFVVRNILLRNV